jgi:dihydroorotate dehydrogenase
MLDAIGQQLLFSFDPETAHGLSLTALRCGVPLGAPAKPDPRLEVTVAGIDLPNPLGMAAGYDKNAEVPDALLGLGFGFAEVGTLTPKPQSGNPKPRIFRLPLDQAVINRLGFNNEGHDAAARRLEARLGRAGVVGVNIGANKDSSDRATDYVEGVRRFSRLGTYLTANISSPNTPGLRDMQARAALAELLERMLEARAGLPADQQKPIFLKIAPDLTEGDLDDIADEVMGQGLDGVIVSNTTISRPILRSRTHGGENGGLSGRPLFSRATATLAKMRKRLGTDMPIVGVGGVDSTEAALEKIRAGADLVQLYTGMIYAGPKMPGRIVSGMSEVLDRTGSKSIRALRDTRLDHWAAQPL